MALLRTRRYVARRAGDKSVLSLLIGIAIDQGQIGGVETPVLAFFPDYRIKHAEKAIDEAQQFIDGYIEYYRYECLQVKGGCTPYEWRTMAGNAA